MSYLNDLNWRYATKRMTGEKVSEDKLNNILEAIRLAPTSFGLQPFKVLVIENQELKEKLKPVSWNQPQVVEASHLLVFAGWKFIDEKQVDEFMQNISETRNYPKEALEEYKAMIMNTVKSRSLTEVENWNARQAYIALGFAMFAAAIEKVDSVPMEGFSPEEYDKILGLTEKGLTASVVLAIGKRSEEDKYAELPKVRRSSDDLFEFIK